MANSFLGLNYAVAGSLTIKTCIIWSTLLSTSFATSVTVNDITLLNPIIVREIVTPKSTNEISQLVKNHDGPISIGGGRFSQGGQIATENTLFIDMRTMNHVLSLDKTKHLITVEAGISWREIQEIIDRSNLSLKGLRLKITAFAAT